jgi:enoyl-CoA hydratase
MSDVATTDEVIVRVENGVGRITLNRPEALHALTTDMCRTMTDALLAWETDPAVTAVLLDHTGERGFCAGGDIRMLADSGAADGVRARAFFFIEYRLNALLMRYAKPTIAIMDGVVMGGGVGLALPCQVRVATERITFAMPETGIGLFPDVGGGWHLPRLPGKTGLWLALTGARIKGADCLALGIATHFVESARTGELKTAILAGDLTAADRFAGDPGPAPLAPHRAEIDRLFGADSVERIFAALAADGGAWAQAQLKTLQTKSPQTLKVALRQLALGGAVETFDDNMRMEYRIGARVVARHDFLEGVRAVIIDKDHAPKWAPETLEGVTEAMLDEIFAPLDEEWSAL